MPRLVDAEFLADMTSGRVRMDVRATMERLVYTKSKDWEYEKEWRISSGTGRNPEARGEDIPFNALELDAVEAGEEEGHAEPEFGDSILEAAWHALDQTVQAQAAELIGDGALEDRFRVASGQSREMAAQIGGTKAFCELSEQDHGVPQRVHPRIGKAQA